MSDDREEGKRAAAARAVAAVDDGDVVGLGTGSTAAYAIDALADRDITGVPTSHQSRLRALEAGVPVAGLDAVDGIDVAIDGADEVAGLALIKGGGGAHAREKVVATAADRFLVVVDDTKLTERLSAPVPVAVLPMAHGAVIEHLETLEGDPVLRTAAGKDGPVVTDDGHFVLDCSFGPIADPAALADRLASLPGVVEHGLFPDQADAVIIGTADEVTVRE